MPRQHDAIDDTIEVEYGQFVVQETSMSRNPLTLPVPAADWVAVGGPGGLLLHSAASDHYPKVRLELWDDIPPAPDGEWDRVVDTTCDVQSDVRLQSVTATYSTRLLTIARPGNHHARVHVGNQEQASRLEEGTYESGIERWTIQLWPA